MVTYGMTIRVSYPVDVVDVASLYKGVLNTLRGWRDVHTYAPIWAAQWAADYDNINVDEMTVGCSHYKIDKDVIKLALVKLQMERDNVASFYCPECGAEGDENVCEECGEQAYAQDADFFVDITDFSAIPAHDFVKVLETDGFPIAERGLRYVIDGVLEEVEYYIEKMENSTNTFDMVAAMIEALGLAHTSGDIFEDYINYGMYGIDFDDILNIRENGLIAYFTPEDVKEFLDS